jgi:mannose/fructose/N-acetylgalactosamine-specific phosphotransferase system component IIC
VWAFLIIALAGAAAYFFAIHGTAASVYWDVAVAAMLGFGFVVAARLDQHRAAWIVILLGQACFLIGDICFSILEHVFHSDAYPNVGDIFYVGGYPLIAVGLVMLLRTRGKSRDAGGVIDGFIVATSVGVLLWVFFVVPTAFDNSLPLFERLINVAYPAGDLLLIAIGAQLAVRQVRRQAPYWIVAVSLLALLVADLGYLYQSLYGGYTERDAIDFGWWMSYALIVAVLFQDHDD